MEANGFRVIHLYGLTESYGPATVCAWQDDWFGDGLQVRSAKMARQGVNYLTLEAAVVMDPETMTPVPQDGAALGEIKIGRSQVCNPVTNAHLVCRRLLTK